MHWENIDNRLKFAQKYNFETFPDIQSIKNNNDVDMVILITPPNQRLELVDKLSSGGKHILMEKPIERTSENAEKIVSICEKNNVNLGIVFQHRYRKSSIKLKSLSKNKVQ